MDKAINSEDSSKPVVAISSCLAGYKVRYDGKDKFNQLIAEMIAPYVTLIPICPEAAVGLGIPRPPIQLVTRDNQIRAIGRDDKSLDVTARLNHFAASLGKVHSNLCGYIFQSRSPSCGYNTTPVYSDDAAKSPLDDSQLDAKTAPHIIGSGLVAAEIHRQLPWLPIVNDSDLVTATDASAFLAEVRQRFHLHHSR